MDERHLTPVQLLAWIDGRLADAAAARHASRCPICKARREAIEHRSPVGEDARDPGRHVDAARLVAYAENLSANGEVAGIETHVLACDECIENLRVIELSLAPEAMSLVTPPEVLARALDAFHRFMTLAVAQRLGTLRIRRNEASAGAYTFRFEPRRGPDPLVLTRRSPSSPPPAQASAPVDAFRFSDEVAAPSAPESAIAGGGADAAAPGSFSLRLGRHVVRVRVEVSPGQIRIELSVPSAFEEVKIAAVDAEGRAVDTLQTGRKGSRWTMTLDRGETHVLIAHPGRAWLFDVLV